MLMIWLKLMKHIQATANCMANFKDAENEAAG
jgi:hypothetical protein